MAAKAVDKVYGRRISVLWLFEQKCF